jgi:2'-5' RNA ligase
MKRLFIAINLPENIKKRIEADIRGFKQFLEADLRGEIRWLPPENWHLTITFLGYQPDQALEPILKSIKETIKKHSNILLNIRMFFEKIILMPPRRPRMIWLAGSEETSKKLDEIKKYLENELIKDGVKFQRENRPYNAHLTLARFQPIARKNVDRTRADAEKILRESALGPRRSALGFQAQSLDLMESHLKRTGAEYEVLAKLTFPPK